MRASPKKSTILLLSFALPAAVMAAVFALCGLAPFGSRSLGVMDMAHQYLAFLYSLRDILAGRASLLYLPSMCLGGNMLGVAAYYLTSPLNLITCLFPRESMYQAVSLLYFLRVGLCGLTMCMYAGRRHGYDWRCLVPAMAYALMAYMLAYSFNYLWQDCVILLPLIALGIARIAEGKKPWLYLFSLAGALYLNFYIGYILCLFSVLFFLYEFFSLPRGEREKPWRILASFALASMAAGGLCALVLLPAFASLSGGKAAFSLEGLTLAPKFSPVSLLAKFYPGAFRYEEIMPDGLPQVFCGTATVTLAVLYFANGGIPRRRRILTGTLMAALALSFWITALDLIWHGLNTPSWYNYRYSFLLSFLLAAAAGRELVSLRRGTRPWHLLLPLGLGGVAGFIVFVGRSYEFVTWRSAAAAMAITAAVCAGAWLYLRPDTGKRLACVLCIGGMLLHVGELAVNAGISMAALTQQATDSERYAEYAAAKGQAFSLVDTGDTFVRVESPDYFSQNRCEPMLFGYDGLSHYGSTLSQKSLDFLDRMGLDRYDDLWAMYGPGVTSAADSLLGVGYVVSDEPVKGYAEYAAAEGYTVWRNQNALPVGWTAPAAIRESIPAADSFAYLDGLYAAAAPEVGERLFTPATVTDVVTENFTVEGGRYTRQELAPGYVTYTLTTQASGALYGELDIPGYPGVMLFVNDGFCALYATAQTNGTVYLGDFAAGETVTVKLQISADVDINHAAFATENAGAVARYSAALAPGGCALTKLTAAHYTGAFTAGPEGGYLVFTLPYDRNWRVTLDGRPVQAEEVQDCLMAVAVTPGAHTVELRYMPAGLIPGAAISAVTLAACAVGYAVKRRRD